MITADKLDRLAIVMRAHGITSLKDGPTLEIVMGDPPKVISQVQNSDHPIEHKVEQLSSLLKLSDRELVDQLFPEQIAESEAG